MDSEDVDALSRDLLSMASYYVFRLDDIIFHDNVIVLDDGVYMEYNVMNTLRSAVYSTVYAFPFFLLNTQVHLLNRSLVIFQFFQLT